MADRRWDPNPTRGKASIFDKVKAVMVLLVEIPNTLIQTLLRRFFRGHILPFKTDFRRSMLRSGIFHVPVSIKRMVLSPRNIPEVRSSNRFRHVSGPLCEEVLEQNVAGFWICRGLKQTLQPNECDLVVLYFHGGAFAIGHPLLSTVSQLRIAEIAEQNGFIIAIFSVNYSLTPEAKHPVQQKQAINAYRYLIEQHGVDPSRVVLSGQSAGGYLTLSLLRSLEDEQLPKPGAAWLLYPWLDLTNSQDSFWRNRYNDTLNKRALDKAAKSFLEDDPSAITDFTQINDLRSTLPKYTWVTVGTHDSFVDSNEMFVGAARKDGADIDIVTYEGGCHAWDASSDFADAKTYLSLAPGTDTGELMKGAGHMAEGLLQIRKKLVT